MSREMTNAMTELMEVIDNRRVDFGYIYHEKSYREKDIDIKFNNQTEFLDQLPKLNIEYYSGYGGQELYGVVVFTDGTWITRGEYDGSEWWENHVLPTRDEVMKND